MGALLRKEAQLVINQSALIAQPSGMDAVSVAMRAGRARNVTRHTCIQTVAMIPVLSVKST